VHGKLLFTSRLNAAVVHNRINGLSDALKKSAGAQTDQTIVINADAKATHQAVVNIMEAARLAGFGRITFTTQNQPN